MKVRVLQGTETCYLRQIGFTGGFQGCRRSNMDTRGVIKKRVSMLSKEVKDDLAKKAGWGKAKIGKNAGGTAMVVTGDPDKLRILNLEHNLAIEKAAFSELKGELLAVQSKLDKEKHNSKAAMYRLEEMTKRQNREIVDLKGKLDDYKNHHDITMEHLNIDHRNQLQEVLQNSQKLHGRAAQQLSFGFKQLGISRKTMENAQALEQTLREQFEKQFAEKERNIDKRCKREIDKIRAEYKHLKEQDELEHESILNSFKAFHKQKMDEVRTYRDELTTLYQHCNKLTKMVHKMENQAYPVRVKPGNIRMFVIPETDKPNEFENYLDRQKLLRQQVNVVRQYDAALDSANATSPSNEPTISSQPLPVDDDMKHIEEKYVPGLREQRELEKVVAVNGVLKPALEISDVSTFVRHVDAILPEKKPFVYEAPPHLEKTVTDEEVSGNDPLDHEIILVEHPNEGTHHVVTTQPKHAVVRHHDARAFLLAPAEDSVEEPPAPSPNYEVEKDEGVVEVEAETPTQAFLREKRQAKLRQRPHSANPLMYLKLRKRGNLANRDRTCETELLKPAGEIQSENTKSRRPETAPQARSRLVSFDLQPTTRTGGFGISPRRPDPSCGRVSRGGMRSPMLNARTVNMHQNAGTTEQMSSDGEAKLVYKKQCDLEKEIMNLHLKRRKKGSVSPRKRERQRPSSASAHMSRQRAFFGRVAQSSSPRQATGRVHVNE